MEYKEIFRLKDMLEKAKIPFTFKKLYDGYQICYPNEDEKQSDFEKGCSVIEHYGSYGHNQDLLEIMGLLTPEESEHDSVVGGLSAENVFIRIRDDYFKNKKRIKLNELTEKLQTLCHEGFSECDVVIGVLDTFYDIEDVHKVSVGNDDNEKILFAIQSK